MKNNVELGVVTHPNFFSSKLCLLYFVAVSASLGTAVSAIGRLMLYVSALFFFLWLLRSKERVDADRLKVVSFFVLLAVGYMALSAFWSTVEASSAVRAWIRHARLLTIPILYLMISNAIEGKAVLRAFVLAQIFVVASAWLLVIGAPVPWATAPNASTTYAVYGSYLEQSVSQSVLAAILWFQRDWILGKRGQWGAIAIAVSSLLLTMGFQIGRTGYLVALTVVMLILIYELPKKYLLLALVVPLVTISLISVFSKNFNERVSQISKESRAYFDTKPLANASSSGERLVFWSTSLKAIKEKPIFGYGSGSWNNEYRRLEAGRSNPQTYSVDNPHQQFLLWAVEGGLLGLALLCALLASIYHASRRLRLADARALQVSLVALVVSSMFNSTIQGIGSGDFFCIALGILLAMRQRRNV